MKKYIALLRGINVSGQKKIKMSGLKNLFESIGFRDVETYIQSGNVVFSYRPEPATDLAEMISSGIKSKYKFDVQVLILNPPDIGRVLRENPFTKKKKEINKLYVTFLSAKPSTENLNRLSETDFFPEEYSIRGRIVYLFFPGGAGRAKLNNNYIENKLKVSATTRNWKTVTALSKLVNTH